MLKKKVVVKDIVVVIAGFVLLFVIFIVVDRKAQILSFPYKSLDIENEYIKITVEYVDCGRHREVYATEDKEEIEKCVEEINSLRLRKMDFIDTMLDPDTYKTGKAVYLGSYRSQIVLEKEDGSSEIIVLQAGERRNVPCIAGISYNGEEYALKGDMSEYILDLFHRKPEAE